MKTKEEMLAEVAQEIEDRAARQTEWLHEHVGPALDIALQAAERFDCIRPKWEHKPNPVYPELAYRMPTVDIVVRVPAPGDESDVIDWMAERGYAARRKYDNPDGPCRAYSLRDDAGRHVITVTVWPTDDVEWETREIGVGTRTYEFVAGVKAEVAA